MSLLGTLFGTPEAVAAVWFAAAVLLVDRFDISLPRGDSMGVSGALVAAGLLSSDASLMVALSVVVVFLARVGRPDSSVQQIAGALLTRMGALALSLLGMYLTAGLASGWQSALRLFLIPTVYLFSEVVFAQAIQSWKSGRPLRRLLLGNLRRQLPLIGAQVSAAILATITYPNMEAWSLLLVVALLMLTRQSLSSLLEMRETYRATVEVLVEAAEGQDLWRKGHAERSAQIARAIADRMGIGAVLMERVSYVTLLHDLDALSVQSSEPSAAGSLWRSSDVLKGSAFFDDVLPALRLCDGCPTIDDRSEPNATIAMIAALSSDIDSLGNTMLTSAQHETSVTVVAPYVTPETKARVVSAAIELGYKIPALG